MDINSDIKNLLGVGEYLEKKFHKLGIFTVNDLLLYPPFRYINASSASSICDIRAGDFSVIKGTISVLNKGITTRTRTKLISAKIEDDSGSINAVWFNQPFLINSLRLGEKKVFIGKAVFNWKEKKLQIQSPKIIPYEKVIPIYHETSGLTSARINQIINNVLNQVEIQDNLPPELLKKYNLLDKKTAVKLLHFPLTLKDGQQARERLGFEELLNVALQLRLAVQNEKDNLISIEIPIKIIQQFVSNLPFKLTDSQRKSAWAILKDLSQKPIMQRMLMGDVGSGKTVVGAIATLAMNKCGFKSVWLAPTEVLANQHFQTLKKVFLNFDLKIGLVTGSHKEKDINQFDLIVGTHALLQPKININNLGLVIVDEQHRFGVNQRSKIKDISNTRPHFLSMSATPIPRTLALALYGNLDISILDELPKLRKKVITKIIEPEKREWVYSAIRGEVAKGRQCFIVAPLIEEDTNSLQLFSQKKSVKNLYQEICEKIFPQYKVGLLHGKLKSDDKKKIMQNFTDKKYDILVSTTVIEVGIDIPNASLLVVENAESYGLATLHQLRGRVGRGLDQSYCYLLSQEWSVKTRQRLEAMEKIDNGFELAEVDLQLRGPGTLLGLKQSGLPEFKLASLTDTKTIVNVREATKWLLQKGLSLSLKNQILANVQTNHIE